MQTSCLIRNILLAGSISLTLASCGGGGGASSSIDSGNNGTSDSNTQQEKVEVPEQLTESMALTLEINGVQTKLDITSPTQCVDVATGNTCEIDYVRTGAKNAVLTVKPVGGTPYQIKLTLTSADSGTYEMEDGTIGAFSMSGLTEDSGSVDNGSSEENSTPDNESGDSPSDNGLAPSSLPVGKVLEFIHRDSVFYQYKIVSEDAAICDGKTCSVEYRKIDGNSAILIVKAGQERVWELTFHDAERGNAQYDSQGTVYDEYTFCISTDGTSNQPSDGNDIPDLNPGEEGESEEDKTVGVLANRTLCLQAPNSSVGSMFIRVGDRISGNVCRARFSFGSRAGASSDGTVVIEKSTKGDKGWESCDFTFHVNEVEISEEVEFKGYFGAYLDFSSSSSGSIDSDSYIIAVEETMVKMKFTGSDIGVFTMEPTTVYMDDSQEPIQTYVIEGRFYFE